MKLSLLYFQGINVNGKEATQLLNTVLGFVNFMPFVTNYEALSHLLPHPERGIHVVELALLPATPPRHPQVLLHLRHPLQVRVVDGEVCVVLLQDPGGRALDG